MATPSASSARPRLVTAKTLLPILLVLAVAGLWLSHTHLTFDWRSLAAQLRSVSILLLLPAIALSYLCYALRAWRWAVLLGPIRKTTAMQMLPAQLIGFTLVGLFGRVADLSRPYMIARRLHTTVATQLAVYSIERGFDLAAAAILFSTTLAFAPHTMPHHEAFVRAGLVSLAATACLAIFAISLRIAGARVASLSAGLLQPVSPSLAAAAATHVLSFAEGLRIVSTAREFFAALALSLLMWLGIALAYLQCVHAFTASPQLAGLSFAATMLLLATSMGGSVLQLPILGWFTQIALLAAALHGFFNVPLETASACGAVLLLVLNLVVIPAGFLAARMQGISLRDAAQSPPAA